MSIIYMHSLLLLLQLGIVVVVVAVTLVNNEL